MDRKFVIGVHEILQSAPSTTTLQGGIFQNDLDSNLGEGMHVFKCIVPLRHGDTLNSRQAACPLMRWFKVEERRLSEEYKFAFISNQLQKEALGGSLPQINLGVQGVIQGASQLVDGVKPAVNAQS
ncbi:hypothetical protein TNCV_4233691 [Trichonephila clavipes]|nr:hypothetical protein TNCV_4233691 [Trichonephila clavipes]